MNLPSIKATTKDLIRPLPALPDPGLPVFPVSPDEIAAQLPERELVAEVVRSTALLSPAQGTENLAGMVAAIARRILKARYVLIALQDQQEWSFSGAGEAPELQASFQRGMAFLEAASRAAYPFCQQDPASDRRTAFMTPDSPDLRPFLGCPIRLKGEPAGILLAFGKTSGEAFYPSDVFLAELLVLQAASLIESSLLYQELQSNLRTTQILYDLTQHISRAESLFAAVQVITRTAQRLFQPEACGLLLYAPNGNKEAEEALPAGTEHPFELVRQVMTDRQMVYLAEDDRVSVACVPVQTSRRCYGALWLRFKETSLSYQMPEKILHLMNQAVVALERSILLAETQQKTVTIQQAYREQQEAHHNFLEALMTLLEARDGETKEHSARVRKLSRLLGIELGLSKPQLDALDRGALLHDIGKIKIRDDVLLKKGPLTEDEWRHMRTHPTVGAAVVQLLPAWQDALPIITYHHERWEGSGYPLGLLGADIPLLARVFAVVDVFDALTTDRPYRGAIPAAEALEYLELQAGVHFDPSIVPKMAALVRRLMQEENGEI